MHLRASLGFLGFLGFQVAANARREAAIRTERPQQYLEAKPPERQRETIRERERERETKRERERERVNFGRGCRYQFRGAEWRGRGDS